MEKVGSEMAQNVKSQDAKIKKGKKKKAAKTPKVKTPNPVIEFFNNEAVRFVLGLVFGIVAVFTLLSLISFIFTWAEDQSLLTNDNVFSSVVPVENMGGKLGFKWSHFLFSKTFGFGAFLVPVFLGGLSLFCFKKEKVNIVKLFFLSLFGCIVISLAFSYIFSYTPWIAIFGDGAGGSYGSNINTWLVNMVGDVIAGAIIVLLLLIWGILLNKKIVGKIINLFNSIFDRFGSKTVKEEISEGESGEDKPQDDLTDGDGSDQEDEDDEIDEDDEDVDDDLVDSDEDEEDGAFEDVEESEGGEISSSGESISGDLPVEGNTQDGLVIDIVPSPDIEIDSEESFGEGSRPNPVVDIDVPASTDDSDFSQGLTDGQWRERYDPRLSLSHYVMPELSLLKDYRDQINKVSRDEVIRNAAKIQETLNNFRIEVSKVSALEGPTVTLYEVVPAPGVRGASIKKLEDDIARSLAARGVRVVNIPGSNAIGIEVANEKPSIVSMRALLADPKFNSEKYALPVVLGRTISNKVMSFDLAKMPHLLVAGATGQGKSVGLNAIITSLLYKKHPAELKFVLVDPKKVELSLYEPIEKHYLAKLPDSEDAIITDTTRVVYTLRSLCKLMDRRYDLLKAASVRDVIAYNEKFLSRKLNPYKGHEYMPYIVVVIDEFADLLMTAGREVEEPIARLAQLARAVGIHLVIATQRPTTNIITGSIKANFPARIAFKVVSSVDSKTILDQTGANQLIGRGDMLLSTGSNDPVRLQCAFIDTPEVDELTSFISRQQGFGSAYLLPEYDGEESSLKGGNIAASSGDRDELFKEAARLIVREQIGSTSLIQRKMQLGYNRAGRIMDQLEEAGIVGPSEGSKPRQVKITSFEALEEILMRM